MVLVKRLRFDHKEETKRLSSSMYRVPLQIASNKSKMNRNGESSKEEAERIREIRRSEADASGISSFL